MAAQYFSQQNGHPSWRRESLVGMEGNDLLLERKGILLKDETMNPKVNHALDDAVLDSMGVYPKSYMGVPRSEWQDGWNACHLGILKRRSAAQEWFSSLPDWKQDIVGEMLADEAISINFVQEALTVQMHFSTSDLFAWGVADSQNITDDDDLRMLYRAYRASGLDGMQILVCIREKEKPQWPVEEMWHKAGLWTPELESLPDNEYDAVIGRWKERSRLDYVAELEKQSSKTKSTV